MVPHGCHLGIRKQRKGASSWLGSYECFPASMGTGIQTLVAEHPTTPVAPASRDRMPSPGFFICTRKCTCMHTCAFTYTHTYTRYICLMLKVEEGHSFQPRVTNDLTSYHWAQLRFFPLPTVPQNVYQASSTRVFEDPSRFIE